MKKLICLSIISAAAFSTACGRAPKHRSGVGSADSRAVSRSDVDSGDKTMLTCTNEGRTYQGFGDIELTAARQTDIPTEGDRFRIKPYAVLKGDYTRVMGAVPSSLDANAATFAQAPERWYVEPVASAVTLFTSYRVAYQSALTLTGADTKYATAPTADTAAAACSSFAQKVWDRAPNQSEVAACVKIAVEDTAAEPDAKARWAYALASVLTATGFIAY